MILLLALKAYFYTLCISILQDLFKFRSPKYPATNYKGKRVWT